MLAPRAVWFLRLFTAFSLAVTFFGTLFLAWTAGPFIERWAFGPVVSKLRIVHMAKIEGDHTELYAEFTKLRDCDYVGIAWFRGSPQGGFERVPVILKRPDYDRSSPNRPLGLQRAGPWEVFLKPEQIVSNSFARLSHKCHGLWTTTTDFFP
jgi:hypothetical protein